MDCSATYEARVFNEETCKGKKGPLEKPELVDYGCEFQNHETDTWMSAQYSDGGWWDPIYTPLLDPYGQIKNAWRGIKGWVREATIVDPGNTPRRG
jgi:hypothetical protein